MRDVSALTQQLQDIYIFVPPTKTFKDAISPLFPKYVMQDFEMNFKVTYN